MDLGTFIRHDGRPAVRFVRTYRQPVEEVWTVISEPAELRHWFPSTVDIEPRVGGTIRFSDDPHVAPAEGRVLAYEPPRHLAFTWGPDELHLTVEPAGDGQTRFTLVNVLGAADTAARNAAGWTVCLDELAKAVAGHPGDGPHSATSTPWQPLYDAYVGAGMPAGAPIPSAT